MCQKNSLIVDVQENYLLKINKKLLELLLKDKTTGKNIIWATDDYTNLGAGYAANDEITIAVITGEHGNVIRPRALKSKEEQGLRTRNMAEVFTPLWICNKMNNLADNAWFGKENVFNIENANEWQTINKKILFPAEKGEKSWRAYLASKRLEITCGEAPYLASRYDTLTGEFISIEQRIGLLDRKLRVLNERVRNLKEKERAKKRWLELAKIVMQSIYGYEWAGDNVLLARENLLYTLNDYYEAKFGESLPVDALEMFAEIISWNIWQMDGLKALVPNSCHDYKKERQAVSPNLFLARDFSTRTLKRSMSFCDVDENELQKCQGCLKDNIDLHNGAYCKIKNWSTGKVLLFKDLLDGEGRENIMSKDFKFDVVIGNPPYQVNDGGGDGNSAVSVYQYLVDQSKIVSNKYVSMITPARWYTGGKGLDEFRNRMLHDIQLAVIHDFPETDDCFSGLNIRGGVCYFLWEKNYKGDCNVYNHKNGHVSSSTRPLLEKNAEIFIRYNKAISILRKVLDKKEETMDRRVSSRLPFGIPSNFSDYTQMPSKEYDTILYRSERGASKKSNKKFFTSSKYITKNYVWKDKLKVLVSKASPGGDEYPHSIITKPIFAEENSVCTETYLIVDFVKNKIEGQNLISYMETKFFRFMMALVKNTQNISKGVFVFVPIQDFSHPWTDEMLYKKYNLTDDEIAFIDSMIKPME